MMDKAVDVMGRVDVLINNAGIQHVAPVDEFPSEKWQDIIDVNLSAPFHLISSVLPGMKQRDFGRIINIASAHGWWPQFINLLMLLLNTGWLG